MLLMSSIRGMLLGSILMGLFGTSQLPNDVRTITPNKSLIIYTSESWGCLRGQEIRADVTTKIGKDDNEFANIEEIKNPEDVNDRYELLIVFSARPIADLTGKFVVKFWCNSDRPDIKAFCSLDCARFDKNDVGNWSLTVKVRGSGFVNGQVLYSREPDLRQAWVSCRGAGDAKPSRLKYYDAYPLEGSIKGNHDGKLDDEWQYLKFRIGPSLMESAVTVDRCQSLLRMLDKEFSELERAMVWETTKITVESLKGLSDQVAITAGVKAFHVLLKADDGLTVHTGSDNFTPHLRQRLALRKTDLTLVGAELWLRAVQ